MTPKEADALDHFLTTPPDEFYKENYNDKFMNIDYNGTEINENDFVFVAYYLESKFLGDHTYTETYKKYVLVQDNFLELLDRKGTEKLDTSKLEIISGKDWLQNV